MARALTLGVDVGGTFTDVVAIGDGQPVRGKVPSTPHDPAGGVLDACDLIAGRLGVDRPGLLQRVGRFGLGTTVVTNVLATRSGRRIGLLTTRGFEDLVPLARGNRVSDGGWLVPPPALVDRVCIAGVTERVDRDGKVLVELDADEAARAAIRLVETERVEVIVVSLLWSFRNPANELAARAAIHDVQPNVRVLLGCELAPVIREYDRTQFALLNAYVDGSLDWLTPLCDTLRDDGLASPLLLTHSSGGATTAAGARAVPIGLAQSGPAAGGAASSQLADALADGEVVTCDLGGTSLDVALISGNTLLRRTRGSIVGHWTSMSMVDVDSVGSGGGSVAWVDPVGAIRVGPRSAGADPGPACYGRGGTEPTLTDALLVLGYLDPTRFLDGRMPLDPDAATRACAVVGSAIGLDPHETAWGIREVALATMARAVRGRIAARGLVPSDLTLFAYGGCGGLFAADIADAVGTRRAVVPDLAPVFSAFGAATAPLRRERARSVATRLPPASGLLASTFAHLARQAELDLASDGITPADCSTVYEADVRFERQGAELTIPLDVDESGAPDLDDLDDRFRAEYKRRFGEGAVALGVAVEVMTLRAVASGPRTPAATEDGGTVVGRSPTGAPASNELRSVRAHRGHPPSAVPVYRRTELVPGCALAGPAIIDASDTTVWLSETHRATVEPAGSLVIEVPAR